MIHKLICHDISYMQICISNLCYSCYSLLHMKFHDIFSHQRQAKHCVALGGHKMIEATAGFHYDSRYLVTSLIQCNQY